MSGLKKASLITPLRLIWASLLEGCSNGNYRSRLLSSPFAAEVLPVNFAPIPGLREDRLPNASGGLA
jgi:hypothetical protein